MADETLIVRTQPRERGGGPGAVLVTYPLPAGGRETQRFTAPFTIGRDEACEVRLDSEVVSGRHATLYPTSTGWWIRDLGSTNGSFLNGKPVDHEEILSDAELQLSEDGPLLFLELEPASRQEDGQKLHMTLPDMKAVADLSDDPAAGEEQPPAEENRDPDSPREKAPAGGFSPGSVTGVLRRYAEDSSPMGGEHTQLMRRAFARVKRTQSRRYLVVIGSVALLLLLVGIVAILQALRLQEVTELGIGIFYDMKALELEIDQFLQEHEDDENAIRRVAEKKKKLKDMRKQYDAFVEETGLFGKYASDQDRLILRMARLFGECELNVPDDFADEVKRYIEKWKTTERLSLALQRVEANDFARRVYVSMAAHQLPPQFLYLALQESDFRAQAIGPKTRFGIAKGFWQFIPATASHYGLKTGPLVELRLYDPHDERFDFDKSTRAAARYLRYIYSTEAQASGLLVMASYNWGHNNVRKLIRKLPENPRERNFWVLLDKYEIPRQTYDYVFYIFAAAVIGENPGLFGFGFDNPLAGLDESVTQEELDAAVERPPCAKLDRDGLLQRLEPTDLAVTRAIEQSDPKPVDTPFLGRALVFRARLDHPAGQDEYHIGCVDKGRAWVLDHDAAALGRLSEEASLDLSEPWLRLAYLRFHLWVTTRARLLDDVDAMVDRLSPSDPLEDRRIKKLRKNYVSVIAAPRLEGDPPWNDSAYVFRGDALLRIEVELTESGRLTTSEEAVEEDLPVAREIGQQD